MRNPPAITSTANPLARRFREVAAGRGRAEGVFLLEGRHLLEEALRLRWPMDAVLVDEKQYADWAIRLDAARSVVTLAPKSLLAKVGTQPAPEGVMALARRPETALPSAKAGERYLYLDGVQDPVNVGILIRSAVAFGITGVFVGAGSADPFGPTALARSAGATLHCPPVFVKGEALLAWCKSGGVALICAEEGGGRMPGGLCKQPVCLAMGNEGHGLSKEIRQAAAGLVGIPMTQSWNSLNVAAAGSILLAALAGVEVSREKR